MRFDHVRVIVTLLAAFSGFCAYLCRLNLSLVIEEMVYTNLDEQATRLANKDLASIEIESLGYNEYKLNSEAQALALLSSGPVRSRRIKSIKTMKQFKIKQQQTRMGGGEPSQLSIELNVSPGANSTSMSSKQDTVDPSKQNSIAEQPVQATDVTTLDESHLLNWDKDKKNSLLGSFFLGYVIFQIPAGRAAEVYGPKIMFMWLAVGTGLSSLLFPLAARAGGEGDSIAWAYAVRFVIGSSQAGLFPAIYVLLCRWLPKNERSSWLAVPSALGRVGTIVMNMLVPALLDAYNWESVFYVSGLITLTWGLAFLLLGSDSPRTSCWISKRELAYIESQMEAARADLVTSSTLAKLPGAQQVACEPEKLAPISWKKLITNVPLLILTLVMFTSEWSNMLLLVKLPGFLGQAARLELKEISMWSSYLVAIYCIEYPLSSVCAARMERWPGLNSLRVRKIFEVLAHGLQATGCLMLAFFDTKLMIICALFVLMIGRALVGGGQCLMPPELSKDYPGSVVALSNSFANTAGIIGPWLVSQLVSDETDYNSWRIVWIISAAIFATAGLIFLIFAQNKPQNYAKRSKNQFDKSISRLDLVVAGSVESVDRPSRVAEEIIKMDAFARVASEPSGLKRRI